MEPNQATPPDVLTLESRQTYVVYHRTGTIVHVHQALLYRGGQKLTEEQNAARALELARQSGHRPEGLRVLRAADDLDLRVPHRVDVKAGRIVAGRPPAGAAGKKPAPAGRKARRR